ncbi:MAG: twin transmembrane helix small protein [Sinobacteraceae bacterium]|nr:twin transmembrane helix small protein [Nevskiaceae bacterium]
MGLLPLGLAHMLAKIVIVLFLLAILGALFSGLYFLLNDPSSSRRTVRALTLRVALSIAFALFLVLAYFMGWVHPHGIGQ